TFWIGNGPPGIPFNGLIDEVSIYSRALSASEIQAIFAAGSAGKCKCGRETIPIPTSQSRAEAGWNLTYKVTAQDGLSVHDVSLGNRYMAVEMSLPYFNLVTTAPFSHNHCALTPDGDPTTGDPCVGRLVDFQTSQAGASPLEIKATYEIDNITSPNGCLFVT